MIYERLRRSKYLCSVETHLRPDLSSIFFFTTGSSCTALASRRAWSLNSTLWDCQWGSASNKVDPLRAPLFLFCFLLGLLFSLVLFPMVSLSKGQSLGCLLRMLTFQAERWDTGWESEREREIHLGQDACSCGRQAPTDFESCVNKCPVFQGQGALTLTTRHACIIP